MEINAFIVIINFMLLLVIGMLTMYNSYFIMKYENKSKQQKDNFCICSGINNKLCADPQQLKKNYALGLTTEYTIPSTGSATL